MAEVFLWTFKGKHFDVEGENTQSYFEIEIANIDTKKGRICEESKDDQMLFRIRHLNTGRLIVPVDVEFEGNKMTTLSLNEHLEVLKYDIV